MARGDQRCDTSHRQDLLGLRSFIEMISSRKQFYEEIVMPDDRFSILKTQ